MANILTEKLINDEIKLEDFLSWITELNYEGTKYQNISELCSQKEFVTYFLNSLHDICISDQAPESPIKQKIQDISTDNSKRKSSSNGFSQNTLDLTCTTSTPLQGRSLCNRSLSKEYSPIPTLNSHHTPSNGSSLCLGDFLVPSKKNSSNKKSKKKSKKNNIGNNENSVEEVVSKKLKPTNLNESRFNSMELQSGNSFNFQNNVEEISPPSTNRNCNVMTRQISITKNKIAENNVSTLPNRIMELKIGNRHIDPKYVRFKNEIEKVVNIYEYLLKHGCVLSLVGELYFIITLLLSRSSCDTVDECDEENIFYEVVTFNVMFKSINNIVFFASSVLDKLSNLLKSLDKITLRYLCDNERLKRFSPNLIEKLQTISEAKGDCTMNLYNSNGKHNICFILETDNRSNFPSDASFHGFKKQRDMFYEILRQWEDNHTLPSWDFESALGRKVRGLVAYHNDPVNFMRFSRLFMEQLMNACSKTRTTANKSSDLPSSLSNLDKDKYHRLKNRLVKKQSNGINRAPDFHGSQEFFKEFIAVSNNVTFLRHLCNALISEIIDLNSTTFDNLDSRDNETQLDTKKSFVVCLKSLKTLAKFLGYIESMPYKNENVYTDEMMAYQIKIRNQVNPGLNVQKLFNDSLSSGNLTLLIPWLCEYLSMLDVVTLRTKYYVQVIEKMINLYRCIVQTDSLLPFYNTLLIEFSLGWFFELNNFPHNVFFEKLVNDKDLLKSKLQKTNGLDRLIIVDYNLLYIFCPFLEEIRKLLANETAVKDRTTSRHITPLTKVESPKETLKKKLEIQLEEAFFNGHPSSLKKTVDFVAERIASSCVKHICYSVVPEFKKEFIGRLQTSLKEWAPEKENISEDELKNNCTKLTEENLTELRALCNGEVHKIVQSRVKNSIIGLLPIDSMPQVQAVCVAAAERMSREKVQQWATTHLVIGVLAKEVKTEMKNFMEQSSQRRKPSSILPPGGSGVKHNPSTENGPHLLNRIMEMNGWVFLKPEKVHEESLIKLAEDSYNTVTQRNDLNEMIITRISSQLLDLTILLATHQPSIIVKIKEHLFKLWKLHGDKAEELFENIICPRNIVILSRAVATEESLRAFTELCVGLINEGLLSSQCLEAQCTGLFKRDLDGASLRTTTTFLKDFVKVYERLCKSSKFTFLLEFLSEYCSDL